MLEKLFANFKGPYALIGLTALCGLLALISLKFNGLFVLGALIALVAAFFLVSYPFWCVPIYYMLLYFRPEDWYPPIAKFRLILLLVALMGGAFGLKVLVFRNTKIIKNPQFVFILGILLAVAFSILESYYRSYSLTRFMDMCRILVMVFLIAHIVDNYKKFKITIWSIIAPLTILGAVNFVLWVTGQKVAHNGGSSGIAGGFLGDGNDFALALNCILPLVVFQFLSRKGFWIRLILAGVAVVFLIAVVATYSRGGMLGSVAVFLMAYWFYIWRTKKFKQGIIVGVIVFFIGAVALILLAPQTFVDRMAGITDYKEDESAMGRLDAWGAGIKMFRDQPLFGVGAGAFATAYGTKYKPFDAVAANWREAHSLYFQALGELGLFGVFFLGGLCFLMLKQQRSIHYYAFSDPAKQMEIHFLADALTTGLVGFLVSGAFLSVTYYPNLYILSTLTIILKRITDLEHS